MGSHCMRPMIFALKYPREKNQFGGFIFLFLSGTFELFKIFNFIMVKLEYLV